MVAEKIRTAITAALGSEADFAVDRPKQAEHGDYASNAALVVAKQEGKNPRQLADQLAGKLSKDDLFASVEVAGPGFLNFRVSPAVWQEALAFVRKEGDKFGQAAATGRKVQVEFISANPTGPLTLGNGRGGFGGDVLANVLSWQGNTVEREYYINDAGNQVVSLGRTLKGEEELYKGEYVSDLKKQVDTKGEALGVGKAAAGVMLDWIKQAAERMHIKFDSWYSEQALYEDGMVETVLGILETNGHLYEKEGALWLKTTDFGDDKDRPLRKSDGEYTYLMGDAAHYYDLFANARLDLKVNILGADHHGYVGRLQALVEMLRKDTGFDGKSDIVITQLVRLIRGGKEVKMSKRAGTYVALDDLLDEVDVDVARFFFIMKSFDTHMDFDLDLAKEQSQKNPVYYLKYAHARICSILKKAPAGKGDLAKLTDPHEFALIRELAEFPALLARTSEDYQIQRLPHYGLQLADTFHQFYENCRVISDDKELTASRLELVRGTQQVLQNLGAVLGITMPEKM